MYTKTDLLVQDVMLELELVPKIDERGLFKEALEIMDMKGLGIICIVSEVTHSAALLQMEIYGGC